jgi:hypothetical protein
MHIVGERLHVREFRIGVQHALGIALAFPRVVDVDVDVAGVLASTGAAASFALVLAGAWAADASGDRARNASKTDVDARMSKPPENIFRSILLCPSETRQSIFGCDPR